MFTGANITCEASLCLIFLILQQRENVLIIFRDVSMDTEESV